MAAGDLIDLDITRVAHGGVFVGRHEGRVVFVPDAIPGERVRVRVTDASKPQFWRAEALEVLDASPHRRPHVWLRADIDVPPEERPGGADFGHIDLEHQRRLKLDVIADALERIGRFDAPEVTIEPALTVVGDDDATRAEETADGTRWRTRVGLHVDAEGRIGPYAARSHRVIEIDDMPLATAEVEAAALAASAEAHAIARGETGRIDLVQPAGGRVRVIVRSDPPREARSARGRRRGATSRAQPPVAASETLVERVGAREFRVDAGGFWQVHRLAAHSLVQTVESMLREMRPAGQAIDPDAWHLDLYGGVGLFAAALGDLGGPATRVTSVESDPRATAHATENLAEWAGARAETGRVDRWISRLAADASGSDREGLQRGVVLLDPPRAGAGRSVVESIASLRPETVVYVACDPVALARDLATFRDQGYDTHRVHAVDLFPHSHHVEAVALLTRSAPAAGVPSLARVAT